MEYIKRNIIVGLVCDYYGTCIDDIKSTYPGDKDKNRIVARSVLCYLIYTNTSFSQNDIGAFLSGNRAMATWATMRVRDNYYSRVRDDVEALQSRIESETQQARRHLINSISA